MTHPTVTASTDNGIALLRIDNPPVNALDATVSNALMKALAAAERDPAVAAIVVIGAGKTFVAGADIGGLERAAWDDTAEIIDLHDLLARTEDCVKPVVMAIHGTAFG